MPFHSTACRHSWTPRTTGPSRGGVEILGAAGLVLPPLTGIALPLAPAAAIGLVLLQAGAIAVHLTGRDRRIALNIAVTITTVVAGGLATTW